MVGRSRPTAVPMSVVWALLCHATGLYTCADSRAVCGDVYLSDWAGVRRIAACICSRRLRRSYKRSRRLLRSCSDLQRDTGPDLHWYPAGFAKARGARAQTSANTRRLTGLYLGRPQT